MASTEKRGVLLVNLGTPDSPLPAQVGTYLREFLMDPLVIDIPQVFRWILVNLLIVPKRSRDSAKLYQKVWTEKGSPLLVHTLDLERKLKAQLSGEVKVVAAMRYGNPSIEKAVKEFKESGVNRILVLPLYPQYSLAATESSILKTRETFSALMPEACLEYIPYFYNSPNYLDAAARVTQEHLKNYHWDSLLFSFHGLPERQVKKTDCSKMHCLQKENCCDEIKEENAFCYRAQSFATSKELANRLGVSSSQFFVGFQSRLKGAPWIRPFSDEFYRELPKKGFKRLAVVCPSFVADCLETLEEVQMRGKEEFLAHGGEDLKLIPSLNSEDVWVEALVNLVRTYQPNK